LTRHAADDAVFAALADPTRRAVFEAVVERGPVSATGLASGFAVSRQAIVKHLTALREAGLVAPERAGREVRFRARPEPLDEVAGWIDRVDRRWAQRLDELRATVAERAGRRTAPTRGAEGDPPTG
jgi:DNA-binding transcriptional ArsR family regulator